MKKGDKNYNYLMGDHFIYFDFNEDSTGEVRFKFEHEESYTKPITGNLMGFLCQNIIDNNDPTALAHFKEILNVCVKRDMENLKTSTSASSYPDVMEALEKSDKFTKIVRPLFWKTGKGFSYKDLANDKIIIPAGIDDQVRRLIIMLGSIKSGNNNENTVKEFTALLDQLYKEKVIPKITYKGLYYKFKKLNKND